MKYFERTYLFFAAAVLALALLASCEKLPEEKPDGIPDELPEEQIGDGITVYGYVTSGGDALEGVVVSDGVEVTVTDDRGRYSLNSLKTCGSIFVSLPSGYEAPADGILPKFFSRLSEPSRIAERVDFDLRKVDQREYRMLLFGDMHLARRSFCDDMGQFRTFAEEINHYVSASSAPVYALTLGDMAWDVFWSSNSFGLPEPLQFQRRRCALHRAGRHPVQERCHRHQGFLAPGQHPAGRVAEEGSPVPGGL